jgi:histidyl-tRNA synthetase
MGGGDVPASGFALYLDSLMNLVKPEAIAPPLPRRILIRFSGDGIKEAFKIADSLRQAGYIAEIDLDGRKTEIRWILEVRGKAPLFTLVDNVKSGRADAQSINEVLKLMEGEGGYKDSPA